MNIVQMKIKDLKPYEKNPRKNDKAVDYVAESIKEFGFKVPIVVDKDNVIVAGHTRYKASKKLGFSEVPCIVADDLNEEQIKAFRLADNKVGEFAEWDFDLLNSELDDLIDIDMELFGFDNVLEEEQDEEWEDIDKGSLTERFIVPPFSIFDTRQGYWQERKRKWKSLGIKSDVGRDDTLLGEGLLKLAQKSNRNLTGTSIFDPVLCEIAYKWFNIEGGKIYDCFAGGSVRGIVASMLGYDYTGIDLRQEQIDANYENASDLNLNVTWYCDDSQNADKYVEDNSVDMIFSCPPYADLEVYSDDPRDISNMDYENFLKVYRNIIEIALRKLKDDRFAVFVVGDVRDKNGFYYDFVSDTKNCFIENGAKLYNEIILLEAGGTASLRANNIFSRGRKVVKLHQHVLVFYKGNPKNIKDRYNTINIDDILEKFSDETIE